MQVAKCLTLFWFSTPCLGVHFIVEQPLNFGVVSISDNSIKSSLTITELGNVSSTHALWRITPGEPGRYRFSGFAPFTRVNFSHLISQPLVHMGNGRGETFELKTLLMGSTQVADQYGELVVPVGGVIESTGNNNPNYQDGDYQTRFSITISY